jgi:hypothetical protein
MLLGKSTFYFDPLAGVYFCGAEDAATARLGGEGQRQIDLGQRQVDGDAYFDLVDAAALFAHEFGPQAALLESAVYIGVKGVGKLACIRGLRQYSCLWWRR